MDAKSDADIPRVECEVCGVTWALMKVDGPYEGRYVCPLCCGHPEKADIVWLEAVS